MENLSRSDYGYLGIITYVQYKLRTYYLFDSAYVLRMRYLHKCLVGIAKYINPLRYCLPELNRHQPWAKTNLANFILGMPIPNLHHKLSCLSAPFRRTQSTNTAYGVLQYELPHPSIHAIANRQHMEGWADTP